MRALTALLAALALFAVTTTATAAMTHCKHVGDKCVAIEPVTGSNMTEQDLTP